MQRRDFIRIMSTGPALTLAPSLLSGCGDETAAPGLEAWDGPASDLADIRLLVLSYAILAPNPHNKQPWIIGLTGPESFDLYVDPSRLLPETDPFYRQIHIGHGTFLENLDIAAREAGYRADIQLFPQGMYGNDELADKPLASVRLEKAGDAPKDPLFRALLIRQSNKRVYGDAPVDAAALEALAAAFDDPAVSFASSADDAVRTRLADILTEAMWIETRNAKRDAETIAMFRFNDEERARLRDGFSIAQSGAGPLKQWIAETFFLSRQEIEADSSEFGAEAVELTGKQAHSAAAFGWITTADNTREDQVRAGRAYERINLTATSLGLAMHPLSQVLQEYADMRELQDDFLSFLEIPTGHTVQMLFRLGHAEPVEHTARRKIESLMRPGR